MVEYRILYRILLIEHKTYIVNSFVNKNVIGKAWHLADRIIQMRIKIRDITSTYFTLYLMNTVGTVGIMSE